MRPSLFNAAIAGIFATGATLAAPALVQAQTCQFLAPVGGNGTTNIVLKTVGPGNPFGRPNWNTDFFVTQPYASYKFFFTADSSVSATYPIQGYLKFTDGSSLQVINESFAPQMGTGRMWGPLSGDSRQNRQPAQLQDRCQRRPGGHRLHLPDLHHGLQLTALQLTAGAIGQE